MRHEQILDFQLSLVFWGGIEPTTAPHATSKRIKNKININTADKDAI